MRAEDWLHANRREIASLLTEETNPDRLSHQEAQESTGKYFSYYNNDAVVIDCSPAMNLLTYNALLYCEEIIVPVGMDLMAIIGARQTLNGVAEVRDLWPDRRLDLLAVLPTFTSATNNATKSALEALEHDPQMGPYLFSPGIRQCIDLNYATSQRQTIWEYAPRSRAAEDYTRFLDFVDRQEEADAHAIKEEAKTAI